MREGLFGRVPSSEKPAPGLGNKDHKKIARPSNKERVLKMFEESRPVRIYRNNGTKVFGEIEKVNLDLDLVTVTYDRPERAPGPRNKANKTIPIKDFLAWQDAQK